ncbi:MAG: DNA-3-methyladenine glycosylase [Pseudomonadota bacterium]
MTKLVALPRGALRHLASADARLARWMKRLGPFAMQRQSGRSHYELLARSIVYQQLSGRAASTIFHRVCRLTPGPGFPRADALLRFDDDRLRAAGLSRQKVAALHDLAAHLVDGRLPLRSISRLGDEQVIQALCAVRGIGRWTAEMFLMFRLGRLDVLPATDLGVQKGLARLDRLPRLPTPRELLARGERWRPYRSVAAWYLWRLVDSENVGGW